MECTQEQYEKDLKQPLLDLGYKDVMNPKSEHLHIIAANVNPYYINGFTNTYGKYAKIKTCFIDHYNPQLFLALSAMTEGEEWIIGEYLVVIGKHLNNQGTIFKVNF